MGERHPHRVLDFLTPEEATPGRRLGAIRRLRRRTGTLPTRIPTDGALLVCGLPR